MATFLKNLFAPKWQHADSDVRLQALDQLSDAQVIELLAKQDPSEAVRLKAISLINNPEYLPSLFNDKSSNVKQSAIAQYLKSLLKTDAPQDQLKAISSIKDAQQLMTVATFSPQAELAQAAINQIKDEATLFDFIMQSASAKSRLLAAQYIQSKDKLKAIEKRFLNKDKTLVRHVKEKLAILVETAAIAEKAQAQVQQLLSNAQQLTQQAFSPTYAGQIALLKQSWQDCQVSSDQQIYFEKAITQCDQVLADHQQQQAEIDANQAAQKQAQALQLDSINQLQVLYTQCKSSVPLSEALKQILDGAQLNWKTALELSSNIDKQIKNEYENLLKPLFNLQTSLEFMDESSIDLEPIKDALQNQSLSDLKQQEKNIKTIVKTVNWPSEFPASSILNSVLTLKNEIENALSSLKQGEDKVIIMAERTLKDFEKAITQGQIKEAKYIQNSLRKQLEKIDSNKTKSLQAQFQLSLQSFNELKDWQGFATLPKFEQLCADMTALVNTDINPKEKADAIRELQEQWKSLGSLPDQKQQQALWQQFKQASDLAYEPCQAYFAEMAKLRTYNLEQRTIICEQLEQFFTNNDWENANWKSVQQILDKAHDEFKKFSPVNHTDKKAIMQRFHDATSNIHDQLVEHFKFNAAQKQALIDDVKALHDAQDIVQAIEQCKALQNEWKEKGNAGRAERQLWSDFREQCDALFEKRNAASQARKQHFDENINKANALIDTAKQLTGADVADASTQLNDITQELNSLELPAKVKQATSKVLSDIKHLLNQEAKNQKRQAQHALWINAQQLAQSLGQAEQRGQIDSDVLADDLESTELPAQVKTILQTRLNSVNENNKDTLERLCLELEILLEVESPAAEQSTRMSLQVERLQKNMGQSLPSLESQLEDLQCRWFAINAQNADYDTLHARFFDTLNNQVAKAE
jgi:hypothetical protein